MIKANDFLKKPNDLFFTSQEVKLGIKTFYSILQQSELLLLVVLGRSNAH
jgi:hypothetical protein